jgi:hypothetical protein
MYMWARKLEAALGSPASSNVFYYLFPTITREMSLYLCGVIRCVWMVCLEGVNVDQIGGQ